MSDDLPRSFSAVTAMLEDLHAVAVEGQQRSNSPDMHLALIGLLLSGIVTLDSRLRSMNAVARESGQ